MAKPEDIKVKPAETPTAVPSVTDISQIYFVVQQGGSSFEWYASSYDTLEEAEEAIRSHNEATYNCLGPYSVSYPIDEAGVMELVEQACRDAATQTYTEVPDETESSAETEEG